MGQNDPLRSPKFNDPIIHNVICNFYVTEINLHYENAIWICSIIFEFPINDPISKFNKKTWSSDTLVY